MENHSDINIHWNDNKSKLASIDTEVEQIVTLQIMIVKFLKEILVKLQQHKFFLRKLLWSSI
jgi:hypothetical protein